MSNNILLLFLFQSFRVRHKSSTEKNLLLSRLPIEPEIMDSIATDHSDQEIKEMNLETSAGSVRSSLPLNIERQFNYFRLVIFAKWKYFFSFKYNLVFEKNVRFNNFPLPQGFFFGIFYYVINVGIWQSVMLCKMMTPAKISKSTYFSLIH